MIRCKSAMRWRAPRSPDDGRPFLACVPGRFSIRLSPGPEPTPEKRSGRNPVSLFTRVINYRNVIILGVRSESFYLRLPFVGPVKSSIGGTEKYLQNTPLNPGWNGGHHGQTEESALGFPGKITHGKPVHSASFSGIGLRRSAIPCRPCPARPGTGRQLCVFLHSGRPLAHISRRK